MGLFPQNVIAVVWDFDNTLIPGYMQRPLFQRFAVDDAEFWAEVGALPAAYAREGIAHVAGDSIYLNHILAYVRAGRFPELSNRMLHDLGRELGFFPGLPDFFPALAQRAAEAGRRLGVTLEHYVVSNGLAAMIRGSAIAPHLAGCWGCEFVAHQPGPGFLAGGSAAAIDASAEIQAVAYVIDNTTKTRALFEINKGTNRHPEIQLNAAVKSEDRRVPFSRMIYLADGPSDVPVFSLLRRMGGRCCAVYRPGDPSAFAQANGLLRQDRVQAVGPADYRDGSQTWLWLHAQVEEIIAVIERGHDQAVHERVGRPPGT